MKETEKNIYVIAFYKFVPIESTILEVKRHKEFFTGRDMASRIYISSEGINGQMSASKEAALAYMEWMHQDSRFADVEFKIHYASEHAFPRATIKAKKQLVAMDVPVNVANTGQHLSPKEWKEMLESRGEDTLLLDVRNNYEWEIGHFEGSELPDLETFRQFPEYVKRLKETKDPKKTKIMMCCTGGIRCELYSALMKEEGFEEVYQLQGGIIKYGLQEGTRFWKGKLFVFDDRIAVPISDKEESEVIGNCHNCGKSSDVYYNCANMDCNALFISCSDCAEASKGCCSPVCECHPKVRPFEKGATPRPFRRWHTYAGA